MGEVTIGTVVKAVSTMDMPGAVLAQNVWFWKMTGTSTRDDSLVLAAVVTAVEAFFTELITQISEECSLDDVIVHEWDYNVEEGWHTGRFVGIADLDVTFTGTADMLPHADAGTITAFTLDVNRRSRKSVAGFTEATQTQSYWIASVLTALAAAGVEWLTDQVVSGADYLAPGLAGNNGIWYALITGLASAIVGSQRQRKPGIGI